MDCLEDKYSKLDADFMHLVLKEKQEISEYYELQDALVDEIDPDATISTLEMLASNAGYHAVAAKIFSFMDYQDLSNCQRVSKRLRRYIRHQRFWYLSFFTVLKNKSLSWEEDIPWNENKELYENGNWTKPDWTVILDYTARTATIEQLKFLVYFFKRCPGSPIFFALTGGISQLGWYSRQPTKKIIGCWPLLNYFLPCQLELNHAFHFGIALSRIICRGDPESQLQKAKISLILKYSKNHQVGFNVWDSYDGTPMHAACGEGSIAIAQMLLDFGLERGLNVNINHCILGTPLHHCGSPEMTQYLLERRNQIGLVVDIGNVQLLSI